MTSNAAHKVNLQVDDDEQDEATKLIGHEHIDRLLYDSRRDDGKDRVPSQVDSDETHIQLSSYPDSFEESSPLTPSPYEPEQEETIPATSLPQSVSRYTPSEARTIVSSSPSMATIIDLRQPTTVGHQATGHQQHGEPAQPLVEPTSILSSEEVKSWMQTNPGQPLPGQVLQAQNPQAQNPLGQNPLGQNPQVQNPQVQNPQAQNPQAQNPLGQVPQAHIPLGGQDATSILSGQEVQQWLASQGQAPQPAAAFPTPIAPAPAPAAPVAAMPPTASTAQEHDELFALPHLAAKKTTNAPESKLLSSILLALVAIVAVFVALAIALPAQRAAIQERIFPTAKPPSVVSATIVPTLAPTAPSQEALHLNVPRLMSTAATAVAAGRRADALEIYKKLAAAYPDVPIYRNLVRALTVSEVNK